MIIEFKFFLWFESKEYFFIVCVLFFVVWEFCYVKNIIVR